jgi:hypothetical protein
MYGTRGPGASNNFCRSGYLADRRRPAKCRSQMVAGLSTTCFCDDVTPKVFNPATGDHCLPNLLRALRGLVVQRVFGAILECLVHRNKAGAGSPLKS